MQRHLQSGGGTPSGKNFTPLAHICMTTRSLPLICSSSTEKRQPGPPRGPPPPSKRPSPVYNRPPPPTKLSAQPSFQTPVLATRRPNNPPPPQSPNPNGYGAPPIRSGPAVQICIATHHTTYKHSLSLSLFVQVHEVVGLGK